MISAVVPTRGGHALERVLGTLMASLAASREEWELIVVDRSGGTAAALAGPVAIVALEEDRGYGPAVNAGAARARGEYLLVLTDDVRLDVSCVRILRAQLPAAGLFAVVPRIVSARAACGDEGGKAARVRGGLVEIVEAPSDATQPTLYPSACCFLCPRPAFLGLGGYDEVYAPVSWEDVDLGYRAWRRGHRILHVPEAVCRRDIAGADDVPDHVAFRNRVLFHLRNLQDRALRARALGAWSAVALFDSDPGHRLAIADALARHASSARDHEDGRSDVEILECVGSNLAVQHLG